MRSPSDASVNEDAMTLDPALTALFRSWRLRLARSRGATAVEYGMMCVLIFALILTGVSAVGSEINRVLSALANSMAAIT